MSCLLVRARGVGCVAQHMPDVQASLSLEGKATRRCLLSRSDNRADIAEDNINTALIPKLVNGNK